MEQCLECRVDFQEAHGIKTLLRRLDSGVFACDCMCLCASVSSRLSVPMT